MVILIGGASHTGKTLLAQKLLGKYHYPYLSLDHLKMGMIRSGMTELTVSDDDRLTEFLWPAVREIIRTVIENGQNLIIEGCYIPEGWEDDFEKRYAVEIRYICLAMTEDYIKQSWNEITSHADEIEKRIDTSGYTPESLIEENRRNTGICRRRGYSCLLIDGESYPDILSLAEEALRI